MGRWLRGQRDPLGGLTREQFAELADIGASGQFGAGTSRRSLEYILFAEVPRADPPSIEAPPARCFPERRSRAKRARGRFAAQ